MPVTDSFAHGNGLIKKEILVSLHSNFRNRLNPLIVLAVVLLSSPAPSTAQEKDIQAHVAQQEYLPVEATETSQEEKSIAELFIPSFRFRDIKISEGNDGRKLVTIATDAILTGRTVRKFSESLLSRGINLYGAAFYGDFSWDRTVYDASITATRKVAGEPDTIEVSEGTARDPKTNLPVMPLTVSINELYIPLAGNFGKSWKKIKIIPDTDLAAPEPKTGRYPGARVRAVSLPEGGVRQIIYAVKGKLQDVEQFYDDKLKQVHKTVIVSGDGNAPPSPAEVFGVKAPAQMVVLSGYSYAAKKLSYTEVTIRRGMDPSLTDYVEVEVQEN